MTKTDQKLYFRSLNQKLLIYVLISSSIITTVITAVSLYLEYSTEINGLNKTMDYIEQSSTGSLANSLWTLDKVQTNIQLNGILTANSIISAYIKNEAGEIAFKKEKNISDYQNKFEIVYKLEFENQGVKIFLGHLHIVATKDLIFDKIKNKLISIFISQGLKTFVISYILLAIFGHIVTRHLIAIANFFKENKIISHQSTQKLSLNRNVKEYDELDQLADAINQMVSLSKDHNQNIINLKDQAQSANKLKSQFLANMSHELRTPLNAILGMGELLMEAEIPKEYRKYVDIQYKAGNNLLVLINDILDFSKIEAGEMQLETIKFDLKDVIETNISILDQMIKEKNNKVKYMFDSEMDNMYNGDPTRIGQILLNLLSNSNKFTDDGTIIVNARPYHEDNEFIHFTIKDSGIGISEDRLEEIFKPFRQENSTVSRKFGGSGIGLSICKRFVEMMGGKIWAESKLGIGSEFHFTIKLEALGKSTKEDNERDQVDIDVNVKSQTILFVEDTYDNQQLVRAFMKKTDHKIEFASDGEEAVDAFKVKKYDVIFMDIQMPKLNGYMATEEIRKIESEKGLEKTPIVALTAYSSKDEIKKCFESGCDDYLTKPLKKKELIGYINKKAYVSASAGAQKYKAS